MLPAAVRRTMGGKPQSAAPLASRQWSKVAAWRCARTMNSPPVTPPLPAETPRECVAFQPSLRKTLMMGLELSLIHI
eukprot:1805841-Pyramimonas_sp.AAC.1